MKKNLQTEAGQANTQKIDAINQVFAVFKRNYHNQFFKAFANETDLNATKRLWLEMLADVAPETMLLACKNIIANHEYLPTLNTMIEACCAIDNASLPDAHEAYIEACRASSPKVEFRWSHPAIYHAGHASDWYFLQTNPESIAFPVFRQEYEKVCARVKQGEKLEAPKFLKLPEESTVPLAKEENLKRLIKLKETLNL